MENNISNYCLHLADNALIYGHRLSELCGHGPALEVDMALSNIALDNIGAARSFYQYAATLIGNGATEDSLAYLRKEREFKNILLVEQANGNFADTIARAVIFDNYEVLLYTALQKSSDTQIAAIAEKSLKEVTYHVRFSKEWCCRLGDGTDVSKQKMQEAINNIWNYSGEMFVPNELDKAMLENNIAPNIANLHAQWLQNVQNILAEATLELPQSGWMHSGGKNGVHSESFGYILSEMQYLQRAYPGAAW
jgi:ring-1,2-phenylacetyl-CoA epoxidase subunit PaaC